ncbi:hypothetical protein MN116_006313 [Schistosoma mekongi]|uniref:Uncharacterized protein n=1 Tax=Schistosoma mekongi TaxID=38744 RepID=A0AAE1ZBK5_SCHME|nr:hypothetical protein MN116_006313 [Schistosoma mekongi]
MTRYSFYGIIQLFTIYQIFCLLFISTYAFSRCATILSNDGLPILTCDHDRSKTESHVDINDDDQNELIPESIYTNDPLRLQQYIVPDKKAFVRLGKRGFVRLGKRGFVRIGR